MTRYSHVCQGFVLFLPWNFSVFTVTHAESKSWRQDNELPHAAWLRCGLGQTTSSVWECSTPQKPQAQDSAQGEPPEETQAMVATKVR